MECDEAKQHKRYDRSGHQPAQPHALMGGHLRSGCALEGAPDRQSRVDHIHDDLGAVSDEQMKRRIPGKDAADHSRVPLGSSDGQEQNREPKVNQVGQKVEEHRRPGPDPRVVAQLVGVPP
jgi:hypothetical protein